MPTDPLTRHIYWLSMAGGWPRRNDAGLSLLGWLSSAGRAVPASPDDGGVGGFDDLLRWLLLRVSVESSVSLATVLPSERERLRFRASGCGGRSATSRESPRERLRAAALVGESNAVERAGELDAADNQTNSISTWSDSHVTKVITRTNPRD